MNSICENEMEAVKYINKTREYLNYLEEHIDNVRKAFCYISEKCKDMYFIKNTDCYEVLKSDIINHDISKFSIQEFVPYRKSFYPISE